MRHRKSVLLFGLAASVLALAEILGGAVGLLIKNRAVAGDGSWGSMVTGGLVLLAVAAGAGWALVHFAPRVLTSGLREAWLRLDGARVGCHLSLFSAIPAIKLTDKSLHRQQRQLTELRVRLATIAIRLAPQERAAAGPHLGWAIANVDTLLREAADAAKLVRTLDTWAEDAKGRHEQLREHSASLRVACDDFPLHSAEVPAKDPELLPTGYAAVEEAPTAEPSQTILPPAIAARMRLQMPKLDDEHPGLS